MGDLRGKGHGDVEMESLADLYVGGHGGADAEEVVTGVEPGEVDVLVELGGAGVGVVGGEAVVAAGEEGRGEGEARDGEGGGVAVGQGDGRAGGHDLVAVAHRQRRLGVDDGLRAVLEREPVDGHYGVGALCDVAGDDGGVGAEAVLGPEVGGVGAEVLVVPAVVADEAEAVVDARYGVVAVIAAEAGEL